VGQSVPLTVQLFAKRAKVQAVKHVLARTDEAARRSVELQARAMADAERHARGTGANARNTSRNLDPQRCAARCSACRCKAV